MVPDNTVPREDSEEHRYYLVIFRLILRIILELLA
jgi:hypothetical protein